MRTAVIRCICVVLVAISVTTNNVLAKKKQSRPAVPLSEKGQKLEAKYAGQLKILQEQIKKALPEIDEMKKAEFTEAYRAEATARAAELEALRKQDRKPEDHPSKAVYAKAEKALDEASKSANEPSKAMIEKMKKFLASDKLDGKLAKCFIMSHATPRGLAEYAQQGDRQEELLGKLLQDEELMFQMAMADGARGGKYGRAMEIYKSIQDGSLNIPAVGCIVSTNNPSKIIFMESNLGGKQLHYSRNGKPTDFEYTVDVPKAGKYELTARVVTPTGDQHLFVKINGKGEPVDMTLPLTLGMWDESAPVEVSLIKGKNVLHCSRGGENIRGVTIKDFTLRPI